MPAVDWEQSAAQTRASIVRGCCPPSDFHGALVAVDPRFRDDWLDLVLGLDEMPDDGPALPVGGVPYLPAPVDALIRVVDHAPVGSGDVFVDVGGGIGRVAMAVALLSGCHSIAVEVQPHLADIGRTKAAALGLDVEFVVADATIETPPGDVYFLYCPFDARAMQRWVEHVPLHARACIATLDVALPDTERAVRSEQWWSDLHLYRVLSG